MDRAEIGRPRTVVGLRYGDGMATCRVCGTAVRPDDDLVVVDGQQLHAGCVELPSAAKRRKSGDRSEVDTLNQLAQGNGRATVV
jgi:hypothetical protein